MKPSLWLLSESEVQYLDLLGRLNLLFSVDALRMNHVSNNQASKSPPPTSRQLSDDELKLFAKARSGDQQALGDFVQLYRDRLKLLISVRIDPRVMQRLDDSDVIQEVFLRVSQESTAQAFHESQHDCHQEDSSPYLWLRRLTIWTLGDLQRKHLGVQQRDPRREVPLHALTSASSMDIARLLIGSETQPLEAMVRIEREKQLQQTLEELEPIDREILMLRHGEQLSRSETAQVLNITIAAAAKRYTRALAKVRLQMKEWES